MNSGPQDSRENFQAQRSAGSIVRVEEYPRRIPVYLEVGLDYMSPLPSNANRAPIPSYTSTNRNTAVNNAFDIPIRSGNASVAERQSTADKRKEELFRETYDMAVKADAVKAKSLKTEWEKESETLNKKGEGAEEERKYKCGAGLEVHRRKF
jgi:hypothetical protein